MNLVIYPDPNKELNVNERMFINVINYSKEFNFTCIEDTKIVSLETTIKDLNTSIKSIIILLDNYGKFIYNNLNFIITSKDINFYINENDIHKNNNKLNAYMRYDSLRSKLFELDHIYILAYYWYHYKKIIKIKPENLIQYPKFVFNKNMLFNKSPPIKKVLLSGSITEAYPIRKYLYSLKNPNVYTLTHQDNIKGDDYMKYLSNYICCFTCCSNINTPYIINKFFEIPGSSSLLLAYDEYVKEPLKELGFIDGENYISCNKENLIDKINWICNDDNDDSINKIRLNGYNLIKNNHTEYDRYKLISSLIK